jgi:2-polyprenyl-3-methyl-5-hydroxy-6-metoxy-1,4-benzoquinol methylase
LSPTAARYARETLGLDVRESDGEDLDAIPRGEFALVTAWSVVEHVQEPRKLLGALAAALAPGGILCLTVPNMNCWRRLLQGGNWFNLRNPTHLVFFRRAALSGLLRELGLEGVARPVFWGGRPGFGPLANAAQYLVRLAGLGSELRLYARKPG